jgi:hypothetical protein
MKNNWFVFECILIFLLVVLERSYPFKSIAVVYSLRKCGPWSPRVAKLPMVIDAFMLSKLEKIKQSFDALTERLSEPDVMNDSNEFISISKERAKIEDTITPYEEWKRLEKEKVSLSEMEKSNDDPELKEMIRGELKSILERQDELERDILVQLLPKDPLDDRNIMIEIRAGTGGDEACIFAGDLVNIYKKYAEDQGWKLSHVSESHSESGGYRTCVLQVTGSHVYSKMKYEVCFQNFPFVHVSYTNIVSFSLLLGWSSSCPTDSRHGNRWSSPHLHCHRGDYARSGRYRYCDPTGGY